MKICFASHNKGKIKEARRLLPSRYKVIDLHDLGIYEEIPETAQTIPENSLLKAQYVFERHHLPVFADDSGLLVEALNGEPGVFSARYAGLQKSDEDNIQLLLKRLSGETNRRAKFLSVVTLIDKESHIFSFEGTVSGLILSNKIGSLGFGYDPIFMPEGFDVSFAQMDATQKNTISHRGKAIKKLITHLKKYKDF